MTRHVVFGTGQVGRPLVEQLLTLGHDVVAVNRSGRGAIPGAELATGDATDQAFTTRVAASADVVYFCLNAAHYDRWAEEFPPLQLAALTGAKPPVPASSCSTTSMPTAPLGAATSSKPCRRSQHRPRPPPGPR